MRILKAILPLLILLVFSQCKKEYRYPEDPEKSKKTPQERLTGSWQIKEYTLNDGSVIDTLNKLYGYDIREQVYLQYAYNRDDGNWEFDLKSIGKYSYNSKSAFEDYHYLQLGAFYAEPGTPEHLFNLTFVTPFKLERTAISRWDVEKLYGEDFWIKLQTDTGLFQIRFYKVEI
jgi:hypothetical protein